MALIYIGRRLALLLPVSFLATFFVFSMARLLPGSAAETLGGMEASVEEIAELKHRLGLDRPLIEQYFSWLGDMLQGDFGRSMFSNRPVLELILQRLEPTLSIAILALGLTVAIAVPLGCMTGAVQGSRRDRFFVSCTGVLISLPVFLLGYLLIWAFSLGLGVLPVQGFVSLSKDPLLFLRHVTLPVITITLLNISFMARITRVAMIEQLNKDFVRTARAKGVPEFVVLSRHALRNAAPSILAVVGLVFLNLVTGVIVTETVFSIPGIGRLVVDAISSRDFPILQGVLILFVVVNLAVNVFLDLLYVLLDPRLGSNR
jgi:peptide/nickel transport system permease protein